MIQYLAPPGTTLTLKKAPVWNSSVTLATSGRRRATQRYAFPLWHFELSYEFLRRKGFTVTQNDLDALFAFFCQAQGQTNSFFFLDLDDHIAVNAPLANGDGTTRTFQLQRVIQVGGLSYAEPVRVVSGTPSIYVNGMEQFPTAIDSNGVVTLATAPANGTTVTWSGTFMFRCAFDDDTLDTQQMLDMFWGLDSLKFTSVKR